MQAFRIRAANWRSDRAKLRAVREAVFVVEQGVPIDLEWDEFDHHSVHCLALSQAGDPVGTGRLLPDGHIGRMAVLKSWRGQGVGSAILRWLMACARARGLTEVCLNAQEHALDFYAQHGFVVEGKPFLDAGIPHRAMRCSLTK
ncbi:MAG TPA: GNAT family N-acetyltransferase [Burkholderiales bacterium]|nr:GNAT family N-acetyltransferase [Burkholderiales bacterium]